jgi:hypothetical protein
MPLRIPPRTPDPTLVAAWSRVATYSEKLFQALDELQDLGGSCKLAASARWSPEVLDRASGQLQAVLDSVETELTQLELRRRHYPRRRRIG